MDDFDEIYDQWVDAVNNTPLTSSRFDEVSDVININTQIINRIYSIRRHLEINESDSFRYHPYRRTTDVFNSTFNSFNSVFNSTLINNLFGILLEGTENYNDNDTNFDDVKVTLTKEQFDTLPCEIINSDNENVYKTLECNICMDEYKQDDKVVKLFCKHYFHKDCIKNWLCDERVTCPICRKDIRETL
jgi:hypothetical protein